VGRCARSIVDSHRGAISAEANLDRDALFHFTLPFAEELDFSLTGPLHPVYSANVPMRFFSGAAPFADGDYIGCNARGR
jgi:hypothetical protein